MTLREACQHFATSDGLPLPDTTLRDLLKRHAVPTKTERRQSDTGRGLRAMVVIPPESLALIEAALSPTHLSRCFSGRDSRGQAPVPRDRRDEAREDSLPVHLHRGESDQAARIADLERRLAIAELRGAPAATPARNPQFPNKRISLIRLFGPNPALREIAAKTVYAARLACCAVLWLYLPEQIAEYFSPVPKTQYSPPEVTTRRYLPKLREARAA